MGTAAGTDVQGDEGRRCLAVPVRAGAPGLLRKGGDDRGVAGWLRAEPDRVVRQRLGGLQAPLQPERRTRVGGPLRL